MGGFLWRTTHFSWELYLGFRGGGVVESANVTHITRLNEAQSKESQARGL